mmetsp:Transcript_3738/g.11637  ORF Transcript_3738/g.11637 Transcript_3738/m.11637 type:complete len:247 (+) Transcript_3738:501-1241(+)
MGLWESGSAPPAARAYGGGSSLTKRPDAAARRPERRWACSVTLLARSWRGARAQGGSDWPPPTRARPSPQHRVLSPFSWSHEPARACFETALSHCFPLDLRSLSRVRRSGRLHPQRVAEAWRPAKRSSLCGAPFCQSGTSPCCPLGQGRHYSPSRGAAVRRQARLQRLASARLPLAASHRQQLQDDSRAWSHCASGPAASSPLRRPPAGPHRQSRQQSPLWRSVRTRSREKSASIRGPWQELGLPQ